jgi:hypothetical protein
MATAPLYFSTVNPIDYVQIATANTNRDGTGTLGTLSIGVGSGKRLGRLTIQAAGTTTAGVIRFFLSTDGGTTKRLVLEVLVTALTPSTTIAAFRQMIADFNGFVLANTNHILYVSTHNAETFNVVAENSIA